MSTDEQADAYPPWNFSWVVQNELAAMAWPQTEANVQYLIQQGIKHLVTLSPEKLPAISRSSKLDWTVIPIKEFEAPSIKDINKFIEICQRCQLKKQVSELHWILLDSRCKVRRCDIYNLQTERKIGK